MKPTELEKLLKHLVRDKNCLLHGSREDITDGHLISSLNGEIFATDNPAIAILKAIFSNKNAELVYPYFIIPLLSPLKLEIYLSHEDTIGERGFVYVINDTRSFVNRPKFSWQYVSNLNKIVYVDKVEVKRSNFRYPVFDVDKQK